MLHSRLPAVSAVALLFTAGLTLSGITAPPATGAEQEPESNPRMVLLLDSSGSMKEPASGGGTKIDVAKQALTSVVDRLPDEAQVGVRVFGAKVFSRKDPGACQDTQQVVPVGPLDRPALKQAVQGYQPYGETPIGNALKGAAKDLGGPSDSITRTIVLLSDGEPTCAPDPCQVARQLSKKGIDVRINVVGLDVSGKARRALRCIASAGKGTYYDARSAEELGASLVRVSVRDLRTFKLTGPRIDGADNSEAATPMAPGRYVDTLESTDGEKFYLLEKGKRGGVAFSALARPSKSEKNWISSLRVRLITPDGTTCQRANSLNFQILGATPIVSTAARFQPFDTSLSAEECARAKQLLAVVSTSGDPTDIRVQFTSLPQVQNADDLPEPAPRVEDTNWLRPAEIPFGGKVGEIAGGVSPDSAAELRADAAYRDTIRPGEQLVYKVKADYGQGVRFSARASSDPRVEEALDLIGVSFQANAISADGQSLSRVSDSDRGVQGSELYNGSRPRVVTAAVAEIRAKNLLSTHTDVRGAAADGFQYFVVGMARADGEIEVPIRVKAEVVGEPSGAPEYAADAQVGTGATPTGKPSGTAADEPGATTDENDGAIPWLPIGLTVAGLFVVALGYLGFRIARSK